MICDCVGFTVLQSVIGQEIVGHSFSQPHVKPKPVMTFSLAFLALQLVCLFLCYAFLLHSQSHPQLWLLVLCVFFFLQHLIWKCFATNSMSYSVEQLALVMTKCIKHIFTCSISNDCSPWISWMLCWGRIIMVWTAWKWLVHRNLNLFSLWYHNAEFENFKPRWHQNVVRTRM